MRNLILLNGSSLSVKFTYRHSRFLTSIGRPVSTFEFSTLFWMIKYKNIEKLKSKSLSILQHNFNGFFKVEKRRNFNAIQDFFRRKALKLFFNAISTLFSTFEHCWNSSSKKPWEMSKFDQIWKTLKTSKIRRCVEKNVEKSTSNKHWKTNIGIRVVFQRFDAEI